jgi:hypothetical protein
MTFWVIGLIGALGVTVGGGKPFGLGCMFTGCPSPGDWVLTLRGIEYADTSPGDPIACFFEAWSPMSLNDLRFNGEIFGGGIVMLSMASTARRHWFILRPRGSCISIQSGWRLCRLMKSTRTGTSIWLALIISARTKRFSASLKDDSMMMGGGLPGVVKDQEVKRGRRMFKPTASHLLGAKLTDRSGRGRE